MASSGGTPCFGSGDAGLKRRLVQFRVEDPDAFILHDEPIWRDGTCVGHVTSGNYGHSIGAPIALGWIESDEMSSDWLSGGRYEIEIGLRRVSATPFVQAPMATPITSGSAADRSGFSDGRRAFP